MFGVPAEFPPSHALLPRDLRTFSHFAHSSAPSQRDELLQLHILDSIDAEHAALALSIRFFAAASATSSGSFRRPAPPCTSPAGPNGTMTPERSFPTRAREVFRFITPFLSFLLSLCRFRSEKRGANHRRRLELLILQFRR